MRAFFFAGGGLFGNTALGTSTASAPSLFAPTSAPSLFGGGTAPSLFGGASPSPFGGLQGTTAGLTGALAPFGAAQAAGQLGAAQAQQVPPPNVSQSPYG